MNDYTLINVSKHEYADVSFVENFGLLIGQDSNVWTIALKNHTTLLLKERERLFGLPYIKTKAVDLKRDDEDKPYFVDRQSEMPSFISWTKCSPGGSVMEHVRSQIISSFGIVPLHEDLKSFKNFTIMKDRVRGTVMGNVTRSYSSFVTKLFKFIKLADTWVMIDTFMGEVRHLDPSELFGEPPSFEKSEGPHLGLFGTDDGGMVVEVLFEISSEYIKIALINNSKEDFAADIRKLIFKWLTTQVHGSKIQAALDTNIGININWKDSANCITPDIELYTKEQKWTSIFSS